jgi:hypothetical protein
MSKNKRNILLTNDDLTDSHIKISEEKFWEMVYSINWENISKNTSQVNRDIHKFRMLQKYPLDEWVPMFNTHRKKYRALMVYLWTIYPPEKGGLGLGDDSMWDMCAHILGLGYEEYVLNFKYPEKALKRAQERDFTECFSYWIPRDGQYTLPNSMDMIFKI